jgi:hypothetical protein
MRGGQIKRQGMLSGMICAAISIKSGRNTQSYKGLSAIEYFLDKADGPKLAR